MLVPYWAIYEILKELLSHGGNPPGADGEAVIRWGWTAFGGLVGGLVLLYAALMSSHVAAFRILYGLRVRLSEHIGKLPLGYLSNTSTGAIKKTMEQNVEKIEGFIAHTIPDLVNVVATVAVMLAVFFSLDVWLALVCLVVVVLSLFLQFSNSQRNVLHLSLQTRKAIVHSLYFFACFLQSQIQLFFSFCNDRLRFIRTFSFQ